MQPPTLADVVAIIEHLYPPNTAQSWDQVGLVTGDPSQPVRHIHCALDPTLAVIEEARSVGADLLLTHHPLLMRGVHSVATTTAKGASVTTLVIADIALYVAHTNADVADAKKLVLVSGLAIFASPTYKATYTGLLKLFLDQFGTGELVGTIGVPLMLGAGPQHALAPELTLRPVLVEIGCSCPLPGLYLLDSEFGSAPALDAWCERAAIVAPQLWEP